MTASRNSTVPPAAVYREKLFLIAAMAASLMCSGVLKCGSPTPKSTMSTPLARSFSAAAATAIVAEASMRWMRLVRIDAVWVAVVVIFRPFIWMGFR